MPHPALRRALQTRRVRLFLAAAIAPPLIVWSVGGGEPWTILAAIRAFDPQKGAAVFVLFAAALVVRTRRMQLLMPAGPSLRALWPEVAIGLWLGALFPFGLGAWVRPWLVHRRHGIELADALAAIVAERVLGLATLLALLTWVAWWGPTPEPDSVATALDWMRWPLASACVAATALVTGMLVSGHATRQRLLAAMQARTEGRPVLQIATQLVVALDRMTREPQRLARASVHTLGFALLAITAVSFTVSGFPAEDSGLGRATVVWTSLNAAVTAAPTPGGVGPFEAGAIAALSWTGSTPSAARAIALTLHALVLSATAALGLIGLLNRTGTAQDLRALRGTTGAEEAATTAVQPPSTSEV